MANLSLAKVTIVADKVGPELMDYLQKTENADYDLLTVEEVSKDSDTWTFSGYATGRWNYAENVDGYLNPGGNNWGSESLRNELAVALLTRNGSIRLHWTDSDSAMDWLTVNNSASVAVEGDQLVFSQEKGEGLAFTVSNLMAAYGWTLEEALQEYGVFGAELFLDEWKASGATTEPSADDAQTWLEEKMSE